jgi:drug/metabolite transporter (DMT)-like permease
MAGLVVLSTVGLALSDPVTAIFVTAAAPLIHTLIAVVAYGERMLPGSILALTLATVGMILITLEGGALSEAGFRGGEILLLSASVCWAWYSLQARRWFPRTSSLRLTTYSMVACLPLLIVVWLSGLSFGVSKLPQGIPPADTIVLLFWVVITGTCAGVILWHGAMYTLGGAVMAIYLALAPLFGVVIGLFLDSCLASFSLWGVYLLF